MIKFLKQPIIIVLVIIIFLAGLFLTFFSSSGKKTQQGARPTPTPIALEQYPLPPISPVAKDQTTVFTIAFSPKDQERTVQEYRVLSLNPYDVASRLADRLLVSPIMTEDSGVRFWKTDTQTVTGQEHPSHISYSVHDLPIQQGQGVPESAAEKLATDALKESGAIGSGYTLVRSGISRFDGTKTHREEGEAGGGMTKVGFTYQLSGLSLVDGTGGTLFASVTLDSTGKMLELSAAVPPATIPSQSVDIIPVAQAVLALTHNKGILTSAQYDVLSVGASLSHPDIKTATITSVTLKYLWDDVSQTIKPIYVFEGYSDDDKEGGRISLTYFVSATL